MNKTILPLLAFVLSYAVARADTFDHSGRNGSLNDGMWLNQTLSPPNVFGNPGAGDDAYFYGAAITASGGSVHLLSGGNLQLSGTVTATNVGTLNLSGGGMLNVQSIVTDANGFGPILDIAGGHLMAQNGDGVGSVTAGGTVVDQTCSGTNGCGFFDGGSSIMITGAAGPGRVILAHASKLTANGGLSNFTLQVASGSNAQVSTVTDGLVRIDGAGSVLTAAGNVSLNGQSMNITNGGAAMVNGNLTQVQGAPLFVSGSGSNLTVGGDLLHNTASDTDVNLDTGATIRVQGDLRQVRGQVQADGANTALTVDQVFSAKAGFVNFTNGATLSANSALSLDGGTDLDGDPISGGGQWSGASTINVSGPMFIGDSATGGSSFTLAVSGGTTVRTADVIVGSEAGSRGTAALSGSGTLWEVQSGSMAIGGSGTGNFGIDSGAHLLLDGGALLGIGFSSGSRGTMTVDGNGSLLDASQVEMRVGNLAGSLGNLVLTNGAQATFGKDTFIGKGGGGSLSLASGSHVSITGGSNTRFGVGDEAGSSGSISVQDAGSNLSVDAIFIAGIHGNGFVGVGNGGMLQSAGVRLGSDTGESGTAVVDGAGSIWNSSSDVFVGYFDHGTGKLTVSSGGAFNISGSATKFGIGERTDTTGELDVDGAGSKVTSSRFIAGVLGTATVQITNGGSLQTGSSVIGVGSSSTGHVSVSGAGSTWTITTSSLNLGGFPGSAGFVRGGPATLTVSNGGLVLVPKMVDIGRLANIILSGGAVGVGTNPNPANNTLRVAANGMLYGYGRVQGQVIVAAGGQIFPGNSPGILTIDGNYQQDANATYNAEIGGPDPGTGYDQISVSGAATLGGILNLRLVNGFTPTVGQTFRLVAAGSISGSFATILPPSQAGVSVVPDATGVTVTITSVVTGAPVINSPTTVSSVPGQPFNYQIAATNNPTSFGATNLPPGLSVDHSTGVISGTPTGAGPFVIPINANNAAGSGQADLTLVVEDLDFEAAPASVPPLRNLSTRAHIMGGNELAIGGLIITGNQSRQILMRGIGPSLPSFVTDKLSDPTLVLTDSSGMQLASNDNWKTNDQTHQSQEAAITATQLAPGNDSESAILMTLAPGAYTVQLRGVNTSTGIGLVEIFDLGGTADSQLSNMSTRGMVGTGDDVLIGGLILGGSGNSTVVVDAMGPSVQVGSGQLPDPTLELHDGNGAIVASNDDWQSDANHSQIPTNISSRYDVKDSALYRVLAPGGYSVIVRGKGSATGIALVEIFNLTP